MITRKRGLPYPLIGFIALLIAWESYILFADPVPTLAPSIAHVFRVFWHSPLQIVLDSAQTLLAVLGTSLIGGGLGTGLGLIMGRHRLLNSSFAAPLLFFSTIPIVTWLPLFVLWAGVGQLPILACGLLASFFPSFQAGRAAASNPPYEYVEAAKNLGAREEALVRTIILPATLPVLLSGWRSSIQLTFLVLPVAEMVLRKGGIGAMVGRGMDLARADLILLAQLALGFIGATSFFLIDQAERHWLRWMHEEDSGS